MTTNKCNKLGCAFELTMPDQGFSRRADMIYGPTQLGEAKRTCITLHFNLTDHENKGIEEVITYNQMDKQHNRREHYIDVIEKMWREELSKKLKKDVGVMAESGSIIDNTDVRTSGCLEEEIGLRRVTLFIFDITPEELLDALNIDQDTLGINLKRDVLNNSIVEKLLRGPDLLVEDAPQHKDVPEYPVLPPPEES